MKPKKNRVFCYDCNRTKMLFETEKQALNCIKFNADEIREDSGYAPKRAYFCEACCGWHLTSMEEFDNPTRTHTQAVIIKYQREKEALHRHAEMKKKEVETASGESNLFARLEKCLDKAEAYIAEGNIVSAKVCCYSVIDRLKNNLSNIEDVVRYGYLMERLTRCVDNCQSAQYWLKKANEAADHAMKFLDCSMFAESDECFKKGVGYLTKACECEGEDDAKKAALQKLDSVQTKLNDLIAWYGGCA